MVTYSRKIFVKLGINLGGRGITHWKPAKGNFAINSNFTIRRNNMKEIALRFLLSKKILVAFVVFSAFALSVKGTFAQGKQTVRQSKPTVVIIRADWCTACQKLEPIMMQLMKEYEGKLNFVVLDVSNEEKTEQAAAMARSLGFYKFFKQNAGMTSTVAIFKGRKMIYKTIQNFDREAYVVAFNMALRQKSKTSKA
ncbi:MAG: hypothetical protein D6687_03955 [Acidobacteria bacterium]|nr:MAG: hypothetical protein D6687_03955 [Acidobacteriota bacterium]